MEVKNRGKKTKQIEIFLRDFPDILLLSVPLDYKCPELQTRNNTQAQLYISPLIFTWIQQLPSAIL